MTKSEARKGAQMVADANNISMVLAFNPYEETSDEDDKYGYWPLRSRKIFHLEMVVEIIDART